MRILLAVLQVVSSVHGHMSSAFARWLAWLLLALIAWTVLVLLMLPAVFGRGRGARW